MEKQQKTLHVYYKGCEQRIKVYDGTKEDKIIKMIKRLFKITASDEQIFFQDENGDIIILPEAFPQDLSFYVYIRPEYPEITKSIENKNTMGQKKSLPGFKWRRDLCDEGVSDDGYIFNAKNHFGGFNETMGTTEYTKGKLFCKLFINPANELTIGVSKYGFLNKPFSLEQGLEPFYLSFLLDMDKRKIIFYKLNDKDGNPIKITKLSFNYGEAVIFVHAKNSGSIQILEGGSSDIPEYALKSDDSQEESEK